MKSEEALRDILSLAGRRAAVVGGAALAVSLGGALWDLATFLRSWLVAFLFWFGIAAGCMGVLMIHHLTGGKWGQGIRRILEAGAGTLPLLGLTFLPLLAGLSEIYPWARPEAAENELLRHKSPYLNPPFFALRAVAFFSVWIALAVLLNRWSRRQNGDPAATSLLRRLSGPGLIFLGLTLTFASIDWVMSLEPQWISTAYGAVFIAGQMLSAFAFAAAAAGVLSEYEPLSGALTPARIHDLGNLLLAFILLWAYLSFAQFLIIWSGNLPEESPWYLERAAGGWGVLAVVLVVLHFALPFFLLLSVDVKRNARRLGALAAALLVARFLDLYWLTAPPFSTSGLGPHVLASPAVAAIGGFWLAVFLKRLRSAPLLAPLGPLTAETPIHE
ncbi:MAG: hypothetical protein HY716_14065 [Planctomycetes bacterium]|nr:hypothetical protein [Planctomycetota bacterium]